MKSFCRFFIQKMLFKKPGSTANVKLSSVLIFFEIFKVVLCEELTPTVDIQLLNSGFHRELHYDLFFPKTMPLCDYILEQEFSNELYVNTDQLDDLKRLNKLYAFYPALVNTENPTEKSEPFTVFLFGPARGHIKSLLPIHFRYHKAQVKKPFAKVIIKKPQLHLRCAEVKKAETKCFNGSVFMETATDSKSDCGWFRQVYNSEISTNLSANIPVGDTNFYSIIFYITNFASWTGCACILFVVHRKMSQLKKKLD